MMEFFAGRGRMVLASRRDLMMLFFAGICVGHWMTVFEKSAHAATDSHVPGAPPTIGHAPLLSGGIEAGIGGKGRWLKVDADGNVFLNRDILPDVEKTYCEKPAEIGPPNNVILIDQRWDVGCVFVKVIRAVFAQTWKPLP